MQPQAILLLLVMLFVVVILLPLVLTYTSWAYAVMRGKVTKAYIKENEKRYIKLYDHKGN